MPSASWWKELRHTFLLFAVVGAIGWYFDELMAGLFVASLGRIGSWLYQLWRVSKWLQLPEREPPEAYGIWGEFFDQIYHLKRHEREERDRLQTVVSYLRDSFAALKDATVLLDSRGNIDWCNEAAGRLLGIQYPRDREQAILNLLRSPAASHYLNEADYRVPLLTESPVNPEVRLQFEVTPFGRGSLILFARDVTRESMVEKMRRDFVANVSHELRTPLTVITGYLHTMNELGPVDPRMTRPLLQMQQQAERMETLLRDLLWLSQIEATEGQEEHEAVNIDELLNEVCQSAQVAYPQRSLKYATGGDEILQGDYKQLYSAVSNLVINALKYGEGEVLVELCRREEALCLCVSDCGPGIAPEHIPRMTERFYRIDKSRSQDTGGTGLGLAIVKHVLAVHGAHLEIESEMGVGSVFRCIFPLSIVK